MPVYSVKQVRVELGLSQQEMAEKLGIHLNTYRKKENGISEWKVDEAKEICKLSNIEFLSIKF